MCLTPCTCSRRRFEQRLARRRQESPPKWRLRGCATRRAVCRIAPIAITVCTELHTMARAPAGGSATRHHGRRSRRSNSKKNGCVVGAGCGARGRRFARGSRIPNVQRVGSPAGSGSIPDLSYRTTFSKELWTSSFPLYSMKPNLRNLFMKKLTRARVVPIISARVS